MRWLSTLALCACAGGSDASDTGLPADRNGLAVALEVADADDLDALTARVDEVVLDGRGPDGALAVSWSTGAEVVLIGAGRGGDVVLDLEVGEYRDLTLEVRLSGRDAVPALFAAGWFDERRWELTVEPGLTLIGRDGAFELGQGVDPVVEVVLRPELWFEGLEDDELEEDLGVLLLDPVHNRAFYDQVVQRIVDTTVTRFPGEAAASE